VSSGGLLLSSGTLRTSTCAVCDGCAAPACNTTGSEHIVRTEEDSTTQPHVATAARDRKPDWILPHVDSALPVALISDENG
jgi:hypothetical protein